MSKKISAGICGQPFTITDLERMRQIIRDNPGKNRLGLSRIICNEMGWKAANGKLKEMSCRVAMLKLWREGFIELPPAQKNNNKGIKKYSITSLSDPGFPIEKSIKEIKSIELVMVNQPSTSRLWNELIERYHYLGFKPLAGAQLRYLIYCTAGLLGAISFSASAWKIAPRDNWIGWDHKTRKGNLHLIINNSRYLILPWVKVKHLASKLLSICAKQISRDWQERYAYQPVLLETFVEKDRFLGTCYKAANWVYVGQTQGRGKKDVHNQYALPIKDIWRYPLAKDFRERLRGIK